jgi:hypothetical protein
MNEVSQIRAAEPEAGQGLGTHMVPLQQRFITGSTPDSSRGSAMLVLWAHTGDQRYGRRGGYADELRHTVIPGIRGPEVSRGIDGNR